MMKKKREITLLVILAILILLVYGGIGFALRAEAKAETSTAADALMMEGKLISMTVTHDDTTYVLLRENGSWHDKDDAELLMHETKTTAMAKTIGTLTPSRCIDPTEIPASFTLGAPLWEMTLKSDTMEKTYTFFSYNAILDMYYVKVSGDEKLYLVDRVQAEKCMYAELQLIAPPSITEKGSLDLIAVEVEGEENFRLEKTDDDAYTLTYRGKQQQISNAAFTDLFYAFKQMDDMDCVSGSNFAAVKEQYGLQKPLYQVTFTFDGGADCTLLLGRDAQGEYFLHQTDEHAVYRIAAEDWERVNSHLAPEKIAAETAEK